MTKTIVIDGIEYKLIPVKSSEEKSTPQETSNKAVASENTILDDYSGIKVGVPTVYDPKVEMARKRKKQMENTILRKIPRQDTEMDKFGDLVVGEGIQQDF